MVITPAALDAIFVNFNTRFQAAFTAKKTYWQLFASLFPSSSASETYAWMKTLPKMRKWVGDRVVNNVSAQAMTLVNDEYENTIGLPRTTINDDTIGVFAPRLDMLAAEVAKLPDRLIANALQAGRTTNAYDGQPFFHDSHPTDPDDAASATYQNRFDAHANGGSSGMPLTAANYGTVRSTMLSYNGADGEPIALDPLFGLIVPPQLEDKANAIVKLPTIAQAAAGNDENAAVANVYQGTAAVIVNPYLANESDRWYLAALAEGIRGVFYQEREAPVFEQQTEGSDITFRTGLYVYGARRRGAAGLSLPFLLATAANSAAA